MKTLTTILFLISFSTYAQLPVKWRQTGTWNGFEIVVNQDASNILLSITNTTLKKSIPKSSFTGLTIVTDPKTSPEYQALLTSLAQTINERDYARLERDVSVRENDDLRRQMASLIKSVKDIRAVHAMDTMVVMWVPKAWYGIIQKP